MTRLLTKNDIIELQRHCYGQIEEIKVKQFDTEVTLKVGSMIGSGSYFDIHKFAEDIEKFLVDKIATSSEAQRMIVARGQELRESKQSN